MIQNEKKRKKKRKKKNLRITPFPISYSGVLVLTALGSWLMFDFQPTLPFVCGATTIIGSIYLYHAGGQQQQQRSMLPIGVGAPR